MYSLCTGINSANFVCTRQCIDIYSRIEYYHDYNRRQQVFP